MKEFLSRKQVAFEDVDITTLEDPAGTLRGITGGPIGTPTLVIGDEFKLGYDPDWMEERLG